MPDTTLTSAELAEALANLTDAFLLQHGCFPIDRTTPAEKVINDAMSEAYRLIGQPATPERDRKLSLARAGLEAGKAEGSMRERAALACEAEAALREANGDAAEAGDKRWGPDTKGASMAQYHKSVTAAHLATAIRALPLTGVDKP